MRLIDACALQEEYKARHSGKRLLLIDVAPTVDAVPARRGKWLERNPQKSDKCRLIECSECGKGYIVGFNVPYEDWSEAHKFCVECGADMRG